jgi:cytochrome bd-type quinol oxidase subunit 2
MYGQFFYTSSVLMAIPWLLVIPVLILAYYASYIFVFRKDRFYRLARISLLISTIFILNIAFMLVNNNTLLLQPVRWQTYFNHPNGWNLNLADRTVYPRYFHFITGAIAVAGLGKSGWYLFNKKAEKEYRKEQINSGMMIFFFATMVQVIVGFWFLIAQPKDIIIQFLGRNLQYTMVLVSAIALTLLALFLALKKQVKPLLLTTLVLLILMILTREFLRSAYLGNIFKPSNLEIVRQISPLMVFLIVFAIGIFSLVYMIRLSLKSKSS